VLSAGEQPVRKCLGREWRHHGALLCQVAPPVQPSEAPARVGMRVHTRVYVVKQARVLSVFEWQDTAACKIEVPTGVGAESEVRAVAPTRPARQAGNVYEQPVVGIRVGIKCSIAARRLNASLSPPTTLCCGVARACYGYQRVVKHRAAGFKCCCRRSVCVGRCVLCKWGGWGGGGGGGSTTAWHAKAGEVRGGGRACVAGVCRGEAGRCR